MSIYRRSSQGAVLAVAFWVGLAPATYANIGNIEEATVVSNSPLAAVPDEVRPGVAYLRDYLQAIDAPPEVIASAEEFLSFLAQNGDLISQEVPSLSPQQLEVLSDGMAHGTRAVEALAEISTRLAQQDWLTEVNPQLAENIIRECGRRVVGGRDMYAAAAQILMERDQFEGDARNLLDDFGLSINECIENLRVYSATAAEEVIRLNTFIAQKEQELEEARERGDTEAVKRIESEIEDANERKRQIEDNDDALALIKFLTGLAGMAVGIAGIVSSGGSCAPCYGEVVAGAIAASEGWNELNSDSSTTVTEKSPARRPGINPGGEPTTDEWNAERELVTTDDSLDFIKPQTEGGNFLIARDVETGDIVILQVTPKQKITVDISNFMSGVGSDASLTTEAALRAAEWSTVITPFEILTDSVDFALEGKVSGQTVHVSFTQNPVTEPFVVTIERP